MRLQQKIEYGPSYPTNRPKYFFARAIRLMSHYAVAQDVGLLGYAILIEIALSEDKRRYCSAPQWFKSSLAERLDRKVDAISEAIKRCVDHGWLVWVQPYNKAKASTWVTIPGHIDDSAIDGDRPDFPVNHPVNHPGNDQVNEPVNHPVNDPRYISPLPIPILTPPPPTTEWAEVVKGMIEFGIQETDKPIQRLTEHGTDPALALGIIKYASEAKLWSPGRVRRRLINALPGQDPQDKRLWMPPDLVTAHPAVQLPSTSTDALKQRDRRLRQLEFEFSDLGLKDMTMPAIVERFGLPPDLREKARSYPTWKSTDRLPGLRLAILEFIRDRRGTNNA